MKRLLAAPLLSGLALAAHAHGGHGLPGDAHWHASDTFGWLAVAALAVGAAWFSRRK